jgi:signal transduction histidine kinase
MEQPHLPSFSAKSEEFLEFVSQLSHDFILMEQEQIDDAIQHGLQVVSTFAEVERGYLFLISQDEQKLVLSHEWCHDQVLPHQGILDQVLISDFEDFMQQLRAGKHVQLETDSLPHTPENENMHQVLSLLQIQSFVNIPLFFGKNLLGYIGFDQTSSPVFPWTEDHLKAFTLTGQIIAHALVRKQNEADLQAAHLRLKEENQLLEQLAYLSSHNLQAPINNLLGLVGLMEREKQAEEARKICQKIKFSAELLHRRVAEINALLHTRHQQNAYAQSILLEPCLQRSLEPLDRELKEISAEVFSDFSQAPTAPGIATYWESIFYNLVSNAGKYRSPHRPLRIHLHSELRDGEFILSVSDNGLGIDASKHGEQIFDLHQRFHPEIEGKGIGLFLVRRQVTTLGGTIRVSSEIDKGATFVLRFPQKP